MNRHLFSIIGKETNIGGYLIDLRDEKGQVQIIVILKAIIIAVGLILLIQGLSAFGETPSTDQISNWATNIMRIFVGLILIIVGVKR